MPIARWSMLAFVLALPLAGTAEAQSPAPPGRQELSPAQRLETARRTLQEATLSRELLMRALGAVDKDLIGVIVDPVFKEYAETVEVAREKAIARLYAVNGEVVELRPVTGQTLVEVAKELSQEYVAATDRALRELGESGVQIGRDPKILEADALRVLVAYRYQSRLRSYHDDASPGYDVLLDFNAARQDDARIRDAAARAESDAAAREALSVATQEFRTRGAEIGRAIVESAGRNLAFSRTAWNGEPEPPELTAAIRKARESMEAWAHATDAFADAAESFLQASGDPIAAARWRMRALRESAATEIVVDSWGRQIATAAQLLGASPDELSAISAATDDADVQRVRNAKATLAAFRRWLADVRASGKSPHNEEPSDALIRALRAQLAYEKVARDRALACLRSSLVREAIASMPAPDETYRAPWWIDRWRQRQAQEAQGQPAATTEEPR
jgi:hypothetical protein